MGRLDEIKRAYGYGHKLSKDTYPYWLISRVEELEEYNEALQENSILNGNEVVRLQELNQRYKQALEFYADEETYTDDRQYTSTGTLVHTGYTKIECDNGKKARQALKEADRND